jgi:hypothetical protein
MSDLGEQIARLRKETESRRDRARVDTASPSTFFAQFASAVTWLWRRVVWPGIRWATRPSRWLFGWYRALWSLAVYRRASGGTLRFSKVRAAGMVVATWFVLWFVTWPAIDCLWDGAIYAATVQRDEHVYLLGSQEIDSWTGAHNVEGCTALPCSDRDAIYFRTVGGLFNNLWSLAHGRGLFYPEYVGAAVPYSTSKCSITSYGVRVRFPFRLINTYSYLLAVTCTPLGEKL